MDDRLIASRTDGVESKFLSNRKTGKEGPVADYVACFLLVYCTVLDYV